MFMLILGITIVTVIIVALLLRYRPSWTYVIRKGRHFANFTVPRIVDLSRSMKYKITFHAGFNYEIIGVQMHQINKLVGYSLGLGHHHKNSIRIGWRYYPGSNGSAGQLQLVAYWYDSSVRCDRMLTCFNTDGHTDLSFEIKIDTARSWHRVQVNGVNYSFPREFNQEDFDKGWLLKPYFGGKAKAPKKISITLEKL